jgi:hypothetical protein
VTPIKEESSINYSSMEKHDGQGKNSLLNTITSGIDWQVPDLTRNSDLVKEHGTQISSLCKESVVFLRRPLLGQLPMPEGFLK